MRFENKEIFLLLVIISALISGCNSQPTEVEAPVSVSTQPVETPLPGETSEPTSSPLEFSLETSIIDGRMVYVGVGGDIDGKVNPDLVVQSGATVHVTLINGDGISHDISIPEFSANSGLVSSKGKTTELFFEVRDNLTGTYAYFCTQPGHRQAGQEGKLIVSEP